MARFVSVDPLAEDYPHNAVYAYAENRPIDGIDLDGLEWYDLDWVSFGEVPRTKGNVDDILADPSLNPDEQLGLIFHTNEFVGAHEELANESIDAAVELAVDGILNSAIPGGGTTLKTVTITAKRSSWLGRTARSIGRWLTKSRVDDIAGDVYTSGPSFKKTPRKKSPKKLRKEWEELHEESWPKDKKGKNYVAHHNKPLADGGEDHGRNIIPMEQSEHIKHHKERGDFKRWGKRRGKNKEK